jgi:hypothetical protein
VTYGVKPPERVPSIYADPLEDRFYRDPQFNGLVKMLESFIQTHRYSPSELREAVMLAATRYELRNYRSQFVLSRDAGERFLERTEPERVKP